MRRLKQMTDENLNPAEETSEEETPEEGTPAEGGDGGQPADEQKVKIGEKEYTTEELTQAIKEANDYKALLPEFTKKSQALAAFVGGKDKTPGKEEETPSFLKPEWKPKNYQELGQAMREAVEWGEKRSVARSEQSEKEAQEAKTQVDNFVTEVKKVDKEFDEKDFFKYVHRHKLNVNTVDDLKATYSVYAEANIDGKLAERLALANKTKRASDSVSKPGSSGAGNLPFDVNALRVGGGSILDKAKEAFNKIK